MFDWFRRKKEVPPSTRRPLRGRPRGKRIITSLGTFTNDMDETFSVEKRTIEEIIAGCLTKDRGRMRTLEDQNDYAIRWLTEQEENVVGGNGFRFQSAVMRSNGDFNAPVNKRIEEAWELQSRAENYTVEGEDSGMDETATDKLILRSVARDGFCFIIPHEGFDNATRFAIQILPGDILDHTICTTWRGNRISNGVEIDSYGRVIGYHVYTERGGNNSIDGKHMRIDAANAIFPYVRTYPGQYVGLPWARNVMPTLHGLDKFEEYVLITAREGACKGVFYEQSEENPIGDLVEEDFDQEVYPGVNTLLPPGVKVNSHDPSQPQDTYGDYRKGVLMRAASGLGMSYQSLSGDLSGGNFASQRVGLLDEREIWKGRQTWFCNSVKCRIYKRWLRAARVMLTGLPESITLDAMNKPVFRGRRWSWVDPQKDLQAATIGVEQGFISREKVIADSDSDTDEEGVLRAIKRGKDLEAELGLSLGTPQQAPPQEEPPPEETEEEDTADEQPEENKVVNI